MSEINLNITLDNEDINITVASSVENFVELADVPSSYVSFKDKFLRVSEDEDGLEFFDGAGLGDMLKSTYDTDDSGVVDKAVMMQSGDTVGHWRIRYDVVNSRLAIEEKQADDSWEFIGGFKKV